MKPYIRIYTRFFGYGEQDNPLSELGMDGDNQIFIADIHHIKFRSELGKDTISNLIGITRRQHDGAHLRRKPFYTKEHLRREHDLVVRQRLLTHPAAAQYLTEKEAEYYDPLAKTDRDMLE